MVLFGVLLEVYVIKARLAVEERSVGGQIDDARRPVGGLGTQNGGEKQRGEKEVTKVISCDLGLKAIDGPSKFFDRKDAGVVDEDLWICSARRERRKSQLVYEGNEAYVDREVKSQDLGGSFANRGKREEIDRQDADVDAGLNLTRLNYRFLDSVNIGTNQARVLDVIK